MAEETGEEGFIGIYNSPLAMILLQDRIEYSPCFD